MSGISFSTPNCWIGPKQYQTYPTRIKMHWKNVLVRAPAAWKQKPWAHQPSSFLHHGPGTELLIQKIQLTIWTWSIIVEPCKSLQHPKIHGVNKNLENTSPLFSYRWWSAKSRLTRPRESLQHLLCATGGQMKVPCELHYMLINNDVDGRVEWLKHIRMLSNGWIAFTSHEIRWKHASTNR